MEASERHLEGAEPANSGDMVYEQECEGHACCLMGDSFYKGAVYCAGCLLDMLGDSLRETLQGFTMTADEADIAADSADIRNDENDEAQMVTVPLDFKSVTGDIAIPVNMLKAK